MTDKLEPKDLETLLARLKQEWQELVDLLTSQGRSQERILEVAKIMLRDAAGQYQVKISFNPDGSADLFLTDPEGNTWGRLGVNRDGEAFLALKEKKGEGSFKVVMGASSPRAAAGPAVTPPDASPPDAAPQPIINAPAESPSGVATSPLGPEAQSGDNADLGLVHRLEKLEIQNRRQKFYGALILGVLGVVLVVMAYALFCLYRSSLSVASLTGRGLKGHNRAILGVEDGKVKLDLGDQKNRCFTLGLGSHGAPHLEFYDRDQRLQALGLDGKPGFTLRDKRSLQGQQEPNVFSDFGHGLFQGGAVSGSGEVTLAAPPAGQSAAIAGKPGAESKGEFVGFKASNKYHYPTCRWARGANSLNSIKFKSAAEAQARHYVPCPVCKPPPLSR